MDSDGDGKVSINSIDLS